MHKFKWENGSKVAEANVEINGNIFNVNPAQYEGKTPLSAQNLNAMQDGIYEDMVMAKELSDADIEEYTQKEGYLVNEENKEIVNPKIPRYEEKGNIEKLAYYSGTSTITKEVDDLKKYSFFILQSCGLNQSRVLGSINFTYEQLKKCNNTDLSLKVTFAGEPNNYMIDCYYIDDTHIKIKTAQYGIAILYGVRK